MQPSNAALQVAHAVLWYGREVGSGDELITNLMNSLQIAPADQFVVDGSELRAAGLKELRSFAATAPHSSNHKLVVLPNADQLSPVVVNGLLKLIEEPPSYLLFRLSATRLTGVLPTLRSRCHLVFAGTQTTTDDRYTIESLRVMTVAELFAVADTLAKDEALPAIVTHWLQQLETELLQGKPVTATIATGYTLVDRLRSNINRRLALEWWLLALKYPDNESL